VSPKDVAAIALAFSYARAHAQTAYTSEHVRTAIETLNVVARHMADAMTARHKTFDRAAFLDACMVPGLTVVQASKELTMNKKQEFRADLDVLMRATAAAVRAALVANASGTDTDYRAVHDAKMGEDAAHEAFTAKWGP
jgi:hypothetical protein